FALICLYSSCFSVVSLPLHPYLTQGHPFTSPSRIPSFFLLRLINAVVRLHQGTLALEDNRPGLRVVMTLPA
ncbi:hypothetical protein, partial [Methylobacterium variabile]|uniref:hypothetical protein n=1 Tax=Methylobacterium variabile TaxID=298794 RepID=UPI000AB42415